MKNINLSGLLADNDDATSSPDDSYVNVNINIYKIFTIKSCIDISG